MFDQIFSSLKIRVSIWALRCPTSRRQCFCNFIGFKHNQIAVKLQIPLQIYKKSKKYNSLEMYFYKKW